MCSKVTAVWSLDFFHLVMYGYTGESSHTPKDFVVSFDLSPNIHPSVVYHFLVIKRGDFAGQDKFPWYVPLSASETESDVMISDNKNMAPPPSPWTTNAKGFNSHHKGSLV